jgi:effector-binding domain-containing protein
MEYQVQIQMLTARPLAVVRLRASQAQLSTLIPQACGEVWNFVRAAQIKTAGRHVAIYYDCEINIECGVEVDEPFTSDGRVVASATPAGRVATVAHFGPYQLLSAAHQAVTQTCRLQGHALAGPNWEVYGHWTDDPTQVRTDVFYLLQ